MSPSRGGAADPRIDAAIEVRNASYAEKTLRPVGRCGEKRYLYGLAL